MKIIKIAYVIVALTFAILGIFNKAHASLWYTIYFGHIKQMSMSQKSDLLSQSVKILLDDAILYVEPGKGSTKFRLTSKMAELDKREFVGICSTDSHSIIHINGKQTVGNTLVILSGTYNQKTDIASFTIREYGQWSASVVVKKDPAAFERIRKYQYAQSMKKETQDTSLSALVKQTSPEENRKSTSKNTEIGHRSICHVCHGLGQMRCNNCGGSGQSAAANPYSDDPKLNSPRTCGVCGGRTTVSCIYCGGRGYDYIP